MAIEATPSLASGAQTATRHHEIVVVGGGNGGISVAARLCRAIASPDVAVIEPSGRHYYQPLWTLVGGGVFPKEKSAHSEKSVMPAKATWIRDAVAALDPEGSAVITLGGERVTYDFLVLAPGIQVNWDRIPGLAESLGKDGVCSNYSYEHVDKTWRFIDEFEGGNAVFTHPSTPIKCGGAPQKIAYLADETFRRNGVRQNTNIVFCTANPAIFQVKRYADTLSKVAARKEIDVRFRQDLVELRPASKEAVFRHLDTGEETVQPYDMIHVTPPMSAPDFIKASPLGNADGWVDVDKATLQHIRFPNVFSLGDASSLPTSKTGAAIRKQAPVLVKNLLAARAGRDLTATYDGYTACPLVTGYGKLVMAEFDYDLVPQETFPFDQSQERWSMYQVKARVLPELYWRAIMKGRA
jgi:sulfide:quinone oxidoreductase